MENTPKKQSHSGVFHSALMSGILAGFTAPMLLFTNLPLGTSSDPGNLALARRGVTKLMQDTFRETMNAEATRTKSS